MTHLPEPLWDEKYCAMFLGISARTLWAMRTSGKIPFIRLGKLVKYVPEQIRAWLDAQKQGGTQ